MSRLYLHCELCGRKQADGLLSRAAWGHLEIATGHFVRACPGCRAASPDWETRLRATTNGTGSRVRERDGLSA